MSKRKPTVRIKEERHISIQKFLTITTTMLVVLLLFQSTQVIREYVSNYEANDFAASESELITAAQVWSQPENLTFGTAAWKAAIAAGSTNAKIDSDHAAQLQYRHSAIIFVGDAASREAEIVRQWCQLTKRYLAIVPELPEQQHIDGAEAILVSGDKITTPQDTERLMSYVDRGVHLVFCTMPEIDIIENDPNLSKLMGIAYVENRDFTISGLWVYDNFLIGGEAIYRSDGTPKEEERQDMDLHTVFYKLNAGTKTYIGGMVGQSNIRGEYLPPQIWRNNAGKAYVFAINGSYLRDVSGMGILQSLMFDKQDYDLYPVVNAQTLSIISFPTFVSENEKVMREMYGRTQYGFESEVLLPEMVAVGERNKFKLTCFAAPELDYADENHADESLYSFFMRQLRMERAEVGLSYKQVSDAIPIERLQETIRAFLDTIDSGYDFRCAYANLPDVASVAGEQGIKSVVCEMDDAYPIVGFLNDDTTIQSNLVDTSYLSYYDEFRLKCMETLLAYSCTTIDLTKVLWPESKENDWMAFRERMTSNLSTYWQPYEKYARVTSSQADKRIRTFFKTETASTKEADTLTIQTNCTDSWLILRTHGETIESISGAESIELEENVFLIHMTETQAQAHLKPTVKVGSH